MKPKIISRLTQIAAAIAVAGFIPLLAQADDSVAQQEVMQRLHQPLNLQPAMMATNQFGSWRLDIGAGQSDARARALRAVQNSTGMKTMIVHDIEHLNLVAEGHSAAEMAVLQNLHSGNPA